MTAGTACPSCGCPRWIPALFGRGYFCEGCKHPHPKLPGHPIVNHLARLLGRPRPRKATR